MTTPRSRPLWALYGLLLTAFTIAGLELLSSFVVPPWPARELRPIDVRSFDASPLKAVDHSSTDLGFNSWALHDHERSLHKPPGIGFRTLLVGDSFTEGVMVSQTVGQRIEGLWSKAGRTDMEAVTFGVAATDPVHYYYRIKNVGLQLDPDAIVLHFFSGNDFVYESLSPLRIPPLITERPNPSWLGAVAPRLTWLVANRLNLTQLGNNSSVDEFVLVNEALKKPPAERLQALVRTVKKYGYPNVDEAAIREVLSRGGDKFWDAFRPKDQDQEALAGWILNIMVAWETGQFGSLPSDEEALHKVDRDSLAATLSWLKGAHELARARGIKFLIALIPPPTVDPNYMDFWAPWPLFRRFPIGKQTQHEALRVALESQGIPFIDLAPDLAGRPKTYRLSDGHWTELGTRIAAERIAHAIEAMRDASSASDAAKNATLRVAPRLGQAP